MKKSFLSGSQEVDLGPFADGGELVAASALADGGLVVAFAPDVPQSYRIVHFSPAAEARVTEVEGLDLSIHQVALLGEGQYLLACARSWRRGPGDHDLNGVVVSSSGEVRQRFLLGDGISELRVGTDGTIWTSYFDEGVFGNCGWDEPIGVPGLIQWSPEGEKLWSFEPPPGLDFICDCYAMNITADGAVWLCYYTDFPLVRIEKAGGAMSVWQPEVQGSHAFAVRDDRVLFQGAYDDHEHLYLCRLAPDGGRCAIEEELVLRDDQGEEVRPSGVFAAGAFFWVVRGMQAYRIDL